MYTLPFIEHPTMNYSAYMALAEQLVSEGRTTGPNHSAAMLHYTKLNLKRMQRLNKTAKPGAEIIEVLNTIPFKMHWVIVSEIWCGDAAQNIPFIAKLAELASDVKLDLILRDENIKYMDQFLTNGTRSIPKLVIYNEEGEVIATWGPRPQIMQHKVMAYKEMTENRPGFEEFSEEIHRWYTANRNAELESELLAIFRRISTLATAI